MQKSIKINVFYTNLDKEAEVKYKSLLEQIKQVVEGNKDKYLGLTIEQEEK